MRRASCLDLITALLLSVLSASSLPADEADPALFGALNRGALVFVGELSNVKDGPVANSFPPIYTFTLTFDKTDAPLRGALPEGKTFHYSFRGEAAPALPVGKRFVAIANVPAEGRPAIVRLEPATEETIELAKKATSLPLGWKLEKGKPVSPWAARGETAWPKSGIMEKIVCARTGRPALLAGKDISMKVEQVMAKEVKEFENPFGDGEFKITITNNGKKEVTVPALLREGDEIQWAESVVVLHGDKALVLPVAKPLAKPEPVKLAPGESVSGTIDTLRLNDAVPWPRGGSRAYFTFAIGDLAADNFFYYFSRRHDPIRAERNK